MLQPDVLMKNLKWTSDAANMRVERGEISEARAKEIVAGYATDLTANIDLQRIRLDRAWEYAEVFRTARQWERARAVFEVAVANPPNSDRRVNDSLRLAHVLSEMGRVEEAISRARSILDAAPENRAPIMPALTLEIVPAARGKGFDKELADLLEASIPIYEGTTVNEDSDAGKAFLFAKPFHIKHARKLIVELKAKE
jgi:tetratricopeptide (TPR) repeat protein